MNEIIAVPNHRILMRILIRSEALIMNIIVIRKLRIIGVAWSVRRCRHVHSCTHENEPNVDGNIVIAMILVQRRRSPPEPTAK